MVTGSLSRRYARAFVQLGGENAKTLEKMGTELRTLAKAIAESPELAAALTNPAFPRSDRRKVIAAVLKKMKASKDTTTFAMLLLERDRFSIIPAVSREVDAMIDARAGRVIAEVVSATPLSASQLQQLQTSLEQISGKKVEIQKREDPELLGGVVAKLGDKLYDGSLRTQLRALRDGLTS
jgi:F-type H+-transporting ATPase subunit delta